ncbi:hypothetical protein [Streptomyces litchfieldiae]|uniref:Uncharacterized protein n=1 Tax=Streptomyces litchfieldiae TaxID=3075543 RepID=A0ABU2MWJ5_9ACTN|nr:hypothetical protein [Streptomyces sp. DSM 44938]MDT0346025.1 hypothetical protein [Streptomyces sp. DSM 44938]
MTLNPLRPTAPAASNDDARDVLAALKAALAEHGITLPSLDVDHSTWTSPYSDTLIELGRGNINTARAIAAALTRS